MIETYIRSEMAVVCRPFGRLDWIGAVYLREAVCGSLRRGLQLTVDLEMSDFVDMDGVDAIMDAARTVQDVGGSVLIINAPPELVRLMRIRDILYLFDSNSAGDAQLGAKCHDLACSGPLTSGFVVRALSQDGAETGVALQERATALNGTGWPRSPVIAAEPGPPTQCETHMAAITSDLSAIAIGGASDG